jgi:archaellum component FlaF (FlaF/FlaG flagellin family)
MTFIYMYTHCYIDMTHEQLVLHVTIMDYEDTSVGECVEVPAIIEGKTDNEIIEKMGNIVKGYFEAFPEKKDEIFKKRSITIPFNRKDSR